MVVNSNHIVRYTKLLQRVIFSVRRHSPYIFSPELSFSIFQFLAEDLLLMNTMMYGNLVSRKVFRTLHEFLVLSHAVRYCSFLLWPW